MTVPGTQRADYGIDAPGVVRGMFIAAGACLLASAVGRFALGSVAPAVGGVLVKAALWSGASFVLTALVMLWGSRVGKFWVCDRILARVPWRGDERVLDVGCGRGLMMLGAARLRPGVRVVGLDLWLAKDLSGNTPEAAMANARAEGVADRVELVTADACAMPFPDASFDVVLSMSAIHNIPDAAARERAIREIARMVAPGGRIAVCDILYTRAYADIFRRAGLEDIRRSFPLPIFFIPIRVLTARRSG